MTLADDLVDEMESMRLKALAENELPTRRQFLILLDGVQRLVVASRKMAGALQSIYDHGESHEQAMMAKEGLKEFNDE